MMKDSGSIRLEMLDEASLTRQPEEVGGVKIVTIFTIVIHYNDAPSPCPSHIVMLAHRLGKQ